MPEKNSWRDLQTDNLCRAFLKLKDIDEVYAFLEDLATIGEIKSMAQRLEVARLLSMSKKYPEVVSETGASTATISRVKKCLDYGTGGYKSVLSG
ncbi:MAG: YerC/YecD family TrpR-related protein [Synergistales bacterium]|nr:DNA-binding transcriptional regulator [Synergistaceae bacterium]MDY6400095.1 YerC/YecD family TrpR-related protein [Synergistales bacterium]MDY6401200.1 YerC/YecD family TrpR-related protein [Synergistales bacterium]MDY6404793.1 YerC/YecD family TrpR-related protein [Synergistales bacterium]MDY6410132.1 YerC/YecD family TrpR-related protein [Synergistales bacterium]